MQRNGLNRVVYPGIILFLGFPDGAECTLAQILDFSVDLVDVGLTPGIFDLVKCDWSIITARALDRRFISHFFVRISIIK